MLNKKITIDEHMIKSRAEYHFYSKLDLSLHNGGLRYLYWQTPPMATHIGTKYIQEETGNDRARNLAHNTVMNLTEGLEDKKP